MIEDPPLEPAVNEIETWPFPDVATRDVGALGEVDGVAVTPLEAALSPLAFTVFK